MTENEATPNTQNSLVVIGSSAGGIEALVAFVGRLSPDFPAPIVIAQHLDPGRPSGLGAILDRRSPLPVITIEGHTKLETGRIYLAPANRHLVIRDEHVELEADRRDRPRPSIDLLLSTAARAYGERLFAVILTGSGSDGATGAVSVKEAGGTVIVQNPQTARYPSMPLALPPTIVDHVVDIEDLASLLRDLIHGTRLPTESPEDAEIGAILELVGKNANIDFRAYKPTTILRRIARRMAVTRCKTLADYRDLSRQNPAEINELVMAFLIKVTEFMRDAEAFEYLRTSVLPTLIERGRLAGKKLRVWSAGCASGEEPYSIAMVLADHLGPELPEWTIKIFATDLDEDAIAFARRGLYPSKLLEDLPPSFVDRFFDVTDSGLQISKALRALVIFGQQDLSRAAPFPRIDLVLCRNVLIYFKPELQQHVLDQFSYSLHGAAGYLFLGKAETARPSKAVYELVDKKWKFYRCLQSPLLAPTRRNDGGKGDQTAGSPAQAPKKASAQEDIVSNDGAGSLPAAQPALRIDDMLLRFLPFGAVMVDRGYRITSINTAARQLLGIRDLSANHDFLHAARGLPYQQVRAAIDDAFRERAPITIAELELDRMTNNEARFLKLSVTPMVRDAVDLAAVTVLDVTEQVLTRHRLEAVQREQEQLVRELSGANKRYQEVNKDLQDANEELQAANEEMVITQEELQATNEELEATNEELQATNEELETNNEELHATNEELEATNEELGIRTRELQQMSRTMMLQSRTQEELARSDRMKDEFISLVSHELRTPMVTLNGYAEMLGDVLKESPEGTLLLPKARDYVGRFRKQLDQLGRMIDDLFDVARAQSGVLTIERAPVDLVALVEQTIGDVSPSLKGHEVSLSVEVERPLTIAVDAGRIAQVITNLLQNASKYAPGHRQIEVSIAKAHLPDPSPPMVELTVSDQGPGIPEAALPSLFTRFFQAPHPSRPARAGLGLGLFLCKQIVEAHGGTISVETMVGTGTTFVVRLPTQE